MRPDPRGPAALALLSLALQPGDPRTLNPRFPPPCTDRVEVALTLSSNSTPFCLCAPAPEAWETQFPFRMRVSRDPERTMPEPRRLPMVPASAGSSRPARSAKPQFPPLPLLRRTQMAPPGRAGRDPRRSGGGELARTPLQLGLLAADGSRRRLDTRPGSGGGQRGCDKMGDPTHRRRGIPCALTRRLLDAAATAHPQPPGPWPCPTAGLQYSRQGRSFSQQMLATHPGLCTYCENQPSSDL